MTTSNFTSNRITALITRQRSSRLRDLAFGLALALGATLSLGALQSAAADAAAAPTSHVSLSGH